MPSLECDNFSHLPTTLENLSDLEESDFTESIQEAGGFNSSNKRNLSYAVYLELVSATI